jgi:hypothetical protein
MRYFLDCEFNGFGGELMTLALVREEGHSLYLGVSICRIQAEIDPWVVENVMKVAMRVPEHIRFQIAEPEEFAGLIADYLKDDPKPYIVCDWPDDISYFCSAILTGPGMMAPLKNLRFEMTRVKSYPTDLPGAVQHNAWWDAMAIRHILLP